MAALFHPPPDDRTIYEAVKITMVADKVPLPEKFQQSADAGFDGVSLLGASSYPLKEVLPRRTRPACRCTT